MAQQHPDPAIEEARRLIAQKQSRAAKQVYEARIMALSRPRQSPWLLQSIVMGLLAGLTAFIAFAAGAFVEDQARNITRSHVDWWNEAELAVDAFVAFSEIANSTPRASLGPAILAMQEDHQRFHEIDAPEDAEQAKALIESAMDLELEGIMAFAAQDSDSTVSRYYREATDAWRQARSEMLSLDLDADSLPAN